MTSSNGTCPRPSDLPGSEAQYEVDTVDPLVGEVARIVVEPERVTAAERLDGALCGRAKFERRRATGPASRSGGPKDAWRWAADQPERPNPKRGGGGRNASRPHISCDDSGGNTGVDVSRISRVGGVKSSHCIEELQFRPRPPEVNDELNTVKPDRCDSETAHEPSVSKVNSTQESRHVVAAGRAPRPPWGPLQPHTPLEPPRREMRDPSRA